MLRLILLLLLLAASPAAGASGYRVDTIAEGLDYPWSIAFLPDGAMLVTERVGRLRMIEDGRLRELPIDGVPDVFAAGQAGLFDVLVDPQFDRNGRILLSLAQGDASANGLRVVQARLAEGGLTDLRTLFDAQPRKRGNAHYGGRMALLGDGSLVVGVGDAFILREQAQRLDNHLGKIVRIAPDGSIPDDNPFVGRADARAEIYSLGHRNPQAIVFDAERDALYAHEHGPRGGDELNRIESGRNYGWPIATQGVDYTGARVSPWQRYPGMQPPLLHWTPSIAPAGMALYRGELFPAWRDSLLVAALAEKSVRRVPMRDGKAGDQEILFTELGERLRDVRVGPEGAIYLLTDSAQGRVLRVTPQPDANAAR